MGLGLNEKIKKIVRGSTLPVAHRSSALTRPIEPLARFLLCATGSRALATAPRIDAARDHGHHAAADRC